MLCLQPNFPDMIPLVPQQQSPAYISTLAILMGKIRHQKFFPSPAKDLWSSHMEKFIMHSASTASSKPAPPAEHTDISTDRMAEISHSSSIQTHSSSPCLMVDILDDKPHTLLQNISHIISAEVGKIAQELRGEIALVKEGTDNLETKFNDLLQYVHMPEEDNHTLKQQVSQLQFQQEDLENRERRQNLFIRGDPESVGDAELQEYLRGNFTALLPEVLDIDWRMDWAHCSSAPKPSAGIRPRGIIVRFHFYDSKESLLNSTCNKSTIDYK